MASSEAGGGGALPSKTKSPVPPSQTKSPALPSQTKSPALPSQTRTSKPATKVREQRPPAVKSDDVHRCGDVKRRHRLRPFVHPKNDRPYEGQALGVKLADGTVKEVDEKAIAKVTVPNAHGEGRRILDFLPMTRAEVIEL